MGIYGLLLVIIGLIMVIMGILAFLNKPIEYTPKEPAWQAALKVINWSNSNLYRYNGTNVIV